MKKSLTFFRQKELSKILFFLKRMLHRISSKSGQKKMFVQNFEFFFWEIFKNVKLIQKRLLVIDTREPVGLSFNPKVFGTWGKGRSSPWIRGHKGTEPLSNNSKKKKLSLNKIVWSKIILKFIFYQREIFYSKTIFWPMRMFLWFWSLLEGGGRVVCIWFSRNDPIFDYNDLSSNIIHVCYNLLFYK